MAPIITIENLNKSFRDVKALNNLSFTVESGNCYGFLGPNGAGKSTAMKIIYGKCTRDENPQTKVNVFGYDPAKDELSIKFLSGVVQQEDNLDDELNVFQNLRIYSKFYNIKASDARERIEYLLEFFELKEKINSKIRELSGGMKRRLVIARALLNQPKLLILDEPTTGLDPQVRHLIWDKIRQLQKQNTTVLLTTHYMEEAFQLCNHILIMHKGSKVMEGQPMKLLDENIEKFVLEILNVELISKECREKPQAHIRIEDSPGVMRYYANDISVLKDFADNCMESGNYLIRQTNLEDVFLRTTGRQLND